MKFSELTYKRIDTETLKNDIRSLTERLNNAVTFEEADSAFLAMDSLMRETLMTMRTIAQIRRDIDTRDSFYDEEMTFYDQVLPEVQSLRNDWTRATLETPYRKQLEEKYGAVPFLNAELTAKAFSPALVQDLKKENELTTRYVKLIASAQVPFEGQTYTLSQLSPFKLDPDDDRRLAAWIAEGEWYNTHGEELDQIYDEMVRVRDAMGRKLGFDSYTPMGYCIMKRNCYTPTDVEQFREGVRKYIVPVAARIVERQAQRLGKSYPLNFADKDLAFRSGNPRPAGNPEEILEMGRTFYSELSPETAEFWNSMRENEMMDVESKPGKAAGGYCTMIAALRSPFIFANFNGTSHDVEVITHEAGHAFAGWRNRDRIPTDIINPSLEACEVHSMSMEFFAEPWAEGFFGKDARKFRYTHPADALLFIPYGTMVDHFQHIIFAHPEYTPAQRHGVWAELLAVYMPWVKLGEIPFYGEAKGWQRQTHIYRRPFYYIDYCLAQTVALQFWTLIQEDFNSAFEKYMRYTDQGGTKVFTELLKSAGLDTPFEESCLQKIAVTASVWLENYDLTGIA